MCILSLERPLKCPSERYLLARRLSELSDTSPGLLAVCKLLLTSSITTQMSFSACWESMLDIASHWRGEPSNVIIQ